MNITPEHARELLDGVTPGQWRALHDKWEDEDGTPCEDFYILGGPDGILHTEDFDPDTHNPVANTTLAAAAPDLAHTIAGMEWQWGVERDRPGTAYIDGQAARWINWVGDEDRARKACIISTRGGNPRLVRRLVGPVEAAE